MGMRMSGLSLLSFKRSMCVITLYTGDLKMMSDTGITRSNDEILSELGHDSAHNVWVLTLAKLRPTFFVHGPTMLLPRRTIKKEEDWEMIETFRHSTTPTSGVDNSLFMQYLSS